MHTNPLRILDTKNPMQDLCSAAPKRLITLGTEPMEHFDGVQQILRDAGVPYTINPGWYVGWITKISPYLNG